MIDRWVTSSRSATTVSPSNRRSAGSIPPIAVLVDLTAVFPREPHRAGGYNPAGLQMHTVVEGRLSCWGLCEQGYWWGWVTYEVAYGTQRRSVTHWIPAWTLKRAAG
jgi:hypothetical protein